MLAPGAVDFLFGIPLCFEPPDLKLLLDRCRMEQLVEDLHLTIYEIANKPRFLKFGSVSQLSSEKIDKTQPDECSVEESL